MLVSHQWKQSRVEEHVTLGYIHGADQLSQIRTIVQRDVCPRLENVTLQHAVQIHGQQLHALRQNQLCTGR